MLHVASKIEGINVVLKALGKLIPSLVNVLWVGLLFYYIFSVRRVCVCVCDWFGFRTKVAQYVASVKRSRLQASHART